jgi:hypothetical protein
VWKNDKLFLEHMHFLSKINIRQNKRLSHKILFGFLTLFIVSAISVFVYKIATAAPTEPVPSVSLESQHVNFTNGEAGSWKVSKMAGWTARNKARIVIDVDSELHYQDKATDILLVVDNSSITNDNDEKIQKYHEALVYFTNKVLDEDDDRKIALVTFDYNYHIKSDFTNNRENLLSLINSMYLSNNGTNYYQALNGAEKTLRSYVKQEDRDVIILFLTDGAPDEEDYYQRAEYLLIKRLYPYVTINAVQYEMGDYLNESIESISDNQYSASSATLKDVLFDASVVPYNYDNFVLTDYINDEYFAISGSDAIEVDKGSFSFETENGKPKVTWDLSNVYRSGASATMEINLDLKPEYANEPLLFPTNRTMSVASSIAEIQDEYVSTDLSPVLKADYRVNYVANAPSDCEPSGIPATKTQFIFDIVEYMETAPTCPGYKFAGYKTSTRLKKINDDYFMMPSNDITLVASWAKVGISKSVDGTPHITRWLYKEIAKTALKPDGTYNVDNNYIFGYSSENITGTYTVASTAEDEYPVHYYRGSVTNNNVAFAGFCWKALRTTSTGGVKLVYDGIWDSVNQCNNLRPDHDGYGNITYRRLNKNYYYGTDYTYNSTTGELYLAGVKTLAKMEASTGNSLLGQYTCMSTDENAACETVYYVESLSGSDAANVLPIQANMPFYAIGKTVFNRSAYSPAYVGYMYGNDMTTSKFGENGETSTGTGITISNTSMSTEFWYADDITYNANGDWHFNLVDPYQISSTADYQNLVGKYTFRSNSSSYSNVSVYYIAAISDSTMYYIHILQDQTLEQANGIYTVSDDITDNGDGTYTMVNPQYIRMSEWPYQYTSMRGKFICEKEVTVCSELLYMAETYPNKYDYISGGIITVAKSHDGYNLQDTITLERYELAQNPQNYTDYKFSCNNSDLVCTPENFIMITQYNSKGFKFRKNYIYSETAVWNGTQYELSGPLDIENRNDLTQVQTHHFFCPTEGQMVCDKVRYIVASAEYSNSPPSHDSVLLSNGVTPETLFDSANENLKNSTIKTAIDTWYYRNLVDYTDMIEDTVYCNDRSIKNLAGWSPTGYTNSTLGYWAYWRNRSIFRPSLDCPANDSFTVDAANGNGALIYPVGLMSMDEALLTGHTSNPGYLYYDDSYMWTMTPAYLSGSYAYLQSFGNGSGVGYSQSTNHVRPVISIIPGAMITTGDGSADDPWVIE